MHFRAYYCVLLNFLLVRGFMDVDLIVEFFEKSQLDHNVVLGCGSRKARIRTSSLLSGATKIVTVTDINSRENVREALKSDYKKLGVVLDADCPDTKKLFIQTRNYDFFDSKHFWLILRRNSSMDLKNFFKFINVNINSNVKLALQTNDTHIPIFDVYNTAFARGGSVVISPVGKYNPSTGYQVPTPVNKYFLRKNLTGVTFKSVIVLPESFKGTLDTYLADDTNIHINTFNRFHSRLIQYCQLYHNFSMKIRLDKSWGYMQSDGTMDGMVGDLERKKIDFGLSPLFARKDRSMFISYGRKTWNLRAAFIFRNPRSRKAYQIFVKPLEGAVWCCVIVLAIFLVVVQRFGFLLDEQVRSSGESSWSFSTVCIFGAFCQQGIVAFPSCLGGRTAAYFALVLGLLIYQFYSASLISFLLNVPTTVITSIQDLLDNDFRMGCEDVLYNRDYLKHATDDLTQNVYKILLKNNQSGFLTPEEGLKLVKKGKYAFHVELVTGYPIIQKEFDSATVCELKEVLMFPIMQMHANYQKWSPFKDLIDTCLHRLSENGVVARELLFWHPKKTECIRSGNTITINTGLSDFYPALALLLIGMVVSLLVLAMEIWYENCWYQDRIDFTN